MRSSVPSFLVSTRDLCVLWPGHTNPFCACWRNSVETRIHALCLSLGSFREWKKCFPRRRWLSSHRFSFWCTLILILIWSTFIRPWWCCLRARWLEEPECCAWFSEEVLEGDFLKCVILSPSLHLSLPVFEEVEDALTTTRINVYLWIQWKNHPK